MKRLILSILVVSVLLIAACTTTTTTTEPTTNTTPTTTTVTSTPTPTTTLPTTTPITTPQTTTTEETGPPMAGEWVASIEIGEIWFIVNDNGTDITECGMNIPGFFYCGTSGGTGTSLWFYPGDQPFMTGKQFTVGVAESGPYPWEVVIEGSFDVTGTQASGTWQISSGETT